MANDERTATSSSRIWTSSSRRSATWTGTSPRSRPPSRPPRSTWPSAPSTRRPPIPAGRARRRRADAVRRDSRGRRRLVRHRAARGDRRDLGRAGRPEVVTLGEVDEPADADRRGRRSRRPTGEATQRVPSVWEEPPSAYDEGVVVRAPSDEELQAAAEHFAGSLGARRHLSDRARRRVRRRRRGRRRSAERSRCRRRRGGAAVRYRRPATPRTVVVGGEGISGPSWQEPAAVEVGAEIDRRGPSGDRDVPAAFMTGLVLAAVAVVSLWAGPAYFAAFAGSARARRPGRVLRGAGQAPRAAGVAGRARGRRR